MKDNLIKIWYCLKNPIMTLLKREVVKVAIANLIKSPWLVDFRVWLITLVVEKLVEEIARPLVNLFFRKVGYTYEVLDGKHLLKKIENAADVYVWNDLADRV